MQNNSTPSPRIRGFREFYFLKMNAKKLIRIGLWLHGREKDPT